MARKSSSGSEPATMTIAEAMQRASEYWQAGHGQQAQALCQRVLAASAGQPDALHLLGLMAHASGNIDLALGYLRQACLTPSAPASYVSNLAEMCRQSGALIEAEAFARRATLLDPNMSSGWNNLGIILQEAGELAESAVCLERAIALQPGHAQAHNNLGNTLSRRGELESARAHYAKALALRPDYAEAESNMAHLLSELGHLDKAAEAAGRAIGLNPRLADAYLNLAAIEISRLRRSEALRWLEALLAFAPDHVAGLVAISRSLRHMDRLDAALTHAQRSVALAPLNADTRNALGETLQALGQSDAALLAFEAGSKLAGQARDEALMNRALLLMELGSQTEALAGLDAIIADNPVHVSAWVNRSDLKRFSKDDPDMGHMEKLLSDGARRHDERTSLHFALGKAYLDAGQSSLAFNNFGQGNAMKRSTFDFDVERTGEWMADIARTFSPEVLERLAGLGHPADMPIFVIGMPRSGTSLVEQILASHPCVHGAGELLTMESIVAGISGYPASAARMGAQQLTQMGNTYLARARALAQGRSHVVDKMPANFLHVGLIRLILPNARFVHCRRNPVDTCLSCYTKHFTSDQRFTYDLSELGRFHRHYQTLMAHWRAVLPASRFIEVEYEALVQDQEQETRRLVGALNLPWDDKCLAFHETARPVRTASVTQVRQPIYKTSSGRWKAHAAYLEPLLDALGVDAMGNFEP